ncbi:MAG: hypothetical protein ABSE53_09040 [Terracidiphilus sp.]|jgi:hypothetical protein
MKKRMIAIAGLAVLATLSASAQDIKTNPMRVPFAFIAGNKSMPAGEYCAQISPSTGWLLLLGPTGAVASVEAMRDGDADGLDSLRFRRVGDTWFLEQVKVQGFVETLAPNKLERRELAKLNHPGQQTLIASNAPAH